MKQRVLKIAALVVCVVVLIVLAVSCFRNKDTDSSDNSSKTSSSVVDASDAESDESGDKSGVESDDDTSAVVTAQDGFNDIDENDSTASAEGGNNNQGGSGNGTSGGNGSGDSNAGGNNGSGSGSGKKDNSGGSGSSSGNKNNGNTGSGSGSGTSGGNKNQVTLTGDEKTFVITIYPDIAPKTCENFQNLVNQGFYNGLEFNRVIENFLAQAGDPNGDGTGGSGTTIKGEFSSNGVKNSLSHTTGVVSMNRNPSDPNSASSQFFICYNDNCNFMDGNYAAFGKVTEGFNTVLEFQSIECKTGYDGVESKPVTPITIVLAESVGNDSDGNPMIKFYVTY